MVINVPFIEPFHAHSPLVTVLEKETLESPSVSWFRFSLSGVCLCDPYWELVCWIGQISSTSLHWFTKSGNKLLHAHQHIITDTYSHKYVIHVHVNTVIAGGIGNGLSILEPRKGKDCGCERMVHCDRHILVDLRPFLAGA